MISKSGLPTIYNNIYLLYIILSYSTATLEDQITRSTQITSYYQLFNTECQNRNMRILAGDYLFLWNSVLDIKKFLILILSLGKRESTTTQDSLNKPLNRHAKSREHAAIGRGNIFRLQKDKDWSAV